MNNAAIWIATSAAVIVGIYLTKSAYCLWAFIFAYRATVEKE